MSIIAMLVGSLPLTSVLSCMNALNVVNIVVPVVVEGIIRCVSSVRTSKEGKVNAKH